jgi:hypothetical protein
MPDDIVRHRNLLATALLPRDVPEGHVVRAWLDSWSGLGHVIEGMHEVGYEPEAIWQNSTTRTPARGQAAPDSGCLVASMAGFCTALQHTRKNACAAPGSQQ